MAVPASRQELIDYCLRKLGAPVIEINVDEDQIEDRVDEALQMWSEYHDDGVRKGFLKYQVTQQDLDSGLIIIDSDATYIKSIIPGLFGSSSGMFSIEYQMIFTDALDLRNMGGLANYVQTKQYLNLVNMTIGESSKGFEFNRHANAVLPTGDWFSKMSVGDWVVMEAEWTIDPDLITEAYNDLWLKKYTTALIKRQWGMNLIKFDGMLLPGGVQLNGRQLFDDANAEIDELEQQLRETYELPVDFLTG